MSSSLKTPEQIQIMREGGELLADIMMKLAEIVRGSYRLDDKDPTPAALEAHAQELCDQYGVIPGTKGYRGFPAALCISVNHEVVHGIPDDRKLRRSDLVKLDMVIIHKGLMVDTAITVPVGGVYRAGDESIAQVAYDALYNAIHMCRSGGNIKFVSEAIENTNKKLGYKAPIELGGHSIGEEMHEEPSVPNHKDIAEDVPLVPGMSLAIEPISMSGQPAIKTRPDGWTIIAVDGMRSAHFEHTVIITDGDPIVVTEWPADQVARLLGLKPRNA